MNKPLDAYNLTAEQKECIENSQKSLLASPVNIVRLAKDLGVAEVLKSELGEKISGMIEKRDEGFVIITNKAESKARRRFTIAHELAHFLLHRERIYDGFAENTLYRSSLSNQYELEANRLAGDMLMPLDKVDEYIDREGTARASIGGLADRFDVSVSAMQARLGIPSSWY